MSTNGATVAGDRPLELPPFSLEVQSLDLGPGIKSVGLELIDTESREPVIGAQAAAIWSAIVPSLTAADIYVLDFFSHIERVAEYCSAHTIAVRAAASRCLVIPQPTQDQLRELFERFEPEVFGLRAGAAAATPDAALEGDLSRRGLDAYGLDAYKDAYARYSFCAVCEPGDGWFTILSDSLWSSEAIRRVRPALQPFDVYISRPQ
jgi:hypothetical protein